MTRDEAAAILDNILCELQAAKRWSASAETTLRINNAIDLFDKLRVAFSVTEEPEYDMVRISMRLSCRVWKNIHELAAAAGVTEAECIALLLADYQAECVGAAPKGPESK